MTNNTEARAREVLELIRSYEDAQQTEGALRALVSYGNERAAQEREANAAIARDAVTYVVGEQRDLCDRIVAAILARGAA